MHHAKLTLRMVVGVVLGGLIGWERTVEDRHFGLRIQLLMSLAAAGFTVAALEAVDQAFAVFAVFAANRQPAPCRQRYSANNFRHGAAMRLPLIESGKTP